MPKKVPLQLRKPPESASVADLDAFVHGSADKKQQVATVTSHNRDKSISQQVANTGKFRRATYYLRPEQIRALKLKAVTDERNLSGVVRDAVDAYLGAV